MSSSHKFNKQTNAKRSNTFLPEDVRKEFGGCVKKPRLDVRLTQLTPHSPNKSSLTSPVSHKENVADDLWGEDLCEETVEECMLLASQACPEELPTNNTSSRNAVNQNLEKSKTITKTSTNVFKAPVDVSKVSNSSRLNYKDVPKSFPPRLNNFERSSSIVKSTSLGPVQEEKNENGHGFDIHGSNLSQLEEEHKALKDNFLLKEGEVSILRSQLKQLQVQIETQALDHRKVLEVQAQKFKTQLNEQKKELEVTNTQLQFQIMEATTIRNHCKLLESSSKVKLIEPQAFSPISDKKKSDFSKEGQSYSSFGNCKGLSTPVRGKKKLQIPDVSVSNNSVLNSSEVKYGIREGSVIGRLINEFVFQNSQPDISWILYFRKKQSLCRKIKEAEDINAKILALQKNTRTLENSYTAINKLITLDSASSTAAYPYIITIIQETHEIICRQLHILMLLFGVQSHTERVVLNGAIASSIGTLAGKANNKLMSARPWYEEEEGIESRRALGLLCTLCDTSHVAADLINGTSNLKFQTDCPSHTRISKFSVPKITGLLNNNMTLNDPVTSVNCRENEKTSSEHLQDDVELLPEINYTEYCLKPYGFLILLRDISFCISVQRRTRQFIGLLTGVMKLLISVARKCKLTDDGLGVVMEIIREVVFCCPQVEVVIALFELLALLSPYPAVMRALCKNSDWKTFVDKKHIGLTYFSRDSCLTQVLYRLLPTCVMPVSLRTQLCYHMVHWLYNVTCFLPKEKPWLLDLTGNTRRMCSCRASLAQGLVTTMDNTLCDLEHELSIGSHTKREMQEALAKGIILLRAWLQQDKEFWKNFGRDPFGCQLMLSRIQTELAKLDLDATPTECVNGLLSVDKEAREDATIQEDDENIYNYCNTLSSDSKVLFLK